MPTTSPPRRRIPAYSPPRPSHDGEPSPRQHIHSNFTTTSIKENKITVSPHSPNRPSHLHYLHRPTARPTFPPRFSCTSSLPPLSIHCIFLGDRHEPHHIISNASSFTTFRTLPDKQNTNRIALQLQHLRPLPPQPKLLSQCCPTPGPAPFAASRTSPRPAATAARTSDTPSRHNYSAFLASPTLFGPPQRPPFAASRTAAPTAAIRRALRNIFQILPTSTKLCNFDDQPSTTVPFAIFQGPRTSPTTFIRFRCEGQHTTSLHPALRSAQLAAHRGSSLRSTPCLAHPYPPVGEDTT